MEDKDITLKTVMDHMHSLAEQSRRQMKDMDDRIAKRFEQVDLRLERDRIRPAADGA